MRSLRQDAMMKVVAGDDRGLRDLINCHGLDCDFRIHGRHVLSVACESASVEVVRALLAGGAPVTEPSASGGCLQRDDPLLVVVRLNRKDIFEEMLKKVKKVPCMVPWSCLTERRYAMLDTLMHSGFCQEFVEMMISEVWGSPQSRFLRRYLPVLVASNVLLDKWEISTHAASRFAVALPLSAVPLLLTAKARISKRRISPIKNHAAVSFLYSPQSLQHLARSVIRTYLVQRKLYEKMTNDFYPVESLNLDSQPSSKNGGRGLGVTVREFNSLPWCVLDILFLVEEKREFVESVAFEPDLSSIWLSLAAEL